MKASRKRLKLLSIVAVISAATVGYFLLRREVNDMADEGLHTLTVMLLKTLDLGLWLRIVMTVGGWLPFQISKMVFLKTIFPYLLIVLLSSQRHRWLRRVPGRLKARVRLGYHAVRRRMPGWLRDRHVFQSSVTLAFTVLGAAVFFLLLSVYFWTYLAFIVGFIRVPRVIADTFWKLWKLIFRSVEKTPVNFGLKLAMKPLIWLDREVFTFKKFLPWDDRERAEEVWERTLWALQARKRRELFFQVGWREYRRIIKEELALLERNPKEFRRQQKLARAEWAAALVKAKLESGSLELEAEEDGIETDSAEVETAAEEVEAPLRPDAL